ncbi:hypothetical protein LINPERHAP1_LOCUS31573 [Linum perenne]
MNTTGQVCDGRAGLLFCSSPFASEARALPELVMFTDSTLAQCAVFSDCQLSTRTDMQLALGMLWIPSTHNIHTQSFPFHNCPIYSQEVQQASGLGCSLN